MTQGDGMTDLPPPFTNLPCAGSVTTSISVWTSDAMREYGAACAAAEREACAGIVEGFDVCDPMYIADAIRARGTE